MNNVFEYAARPTLGTTIRQDVENKLREHARSDAIASNLLHVYDRLQDNSSRIDFLLSAMLMMIESQQALMAGSLKLMQESTRCCIGLPKIALDERNGSGTHKIQRPQVPG